MPKRIVMIPVTLLAGLFLLGGTGGPPSSRTQDIPTTYVDCPLERIGSQLVRCDNLTGAGVTAPLWIPEQK